MSETTKTLFNIAAGLLLTISISLASWSLTKAVQHESRLSVIEQTTIDRHERDKLYLLLADIDKRLSLIEARLERLEAQKEKER